MTLNRTFAALLFSLSACVVVGAPGASRVPVAQGSNPLGKDRGLHWESNLDPAHRCDAPMVDSYDLTASAVEICVDAVQWTDALSTGMASNANFKKAKLLVSTDKDYTPFAMKQTNDGLTSSKCGSQKFWKATYHGCGANKGVVSEQVKEVNLYYGTLPTSDTQIASWRIQNGAAK